MAARKEGKYFKHSQSVFQGTHASSGLAGEHSESVMWSDCDRQTDRQRDTKTEIFLCQSDHVGRTISAYHAL